MFLLTWKKLKYDNFRTMYGILIDENVLQAKVATAI